MLIDLQLTEYLINLVHHIRKKYVVGSHSLQEVLHNTNEDIGVAIP